jgi:hypothetical protein
VFAAHTLNNRGEFAGWADTSLPDPFPAFCFFGFCTRICKSAHSTRLSE